MNIDIYPESDRKHIRELSEKLSECHMHDKPVRYLIGVDPGTITGVAIYDRKKKKLVKIYSMSITQAMKVVYNLHAYGSNGVEVWFEDARKRKWFGAKGPEALQGAGSIKRDCTIWADFLTENEISFKAIPPQRGATKWNAKYFKKLTGWEGRTNEHARDAAALVYGG